MKARIRKGILFALLLAFVLPSFAYAAEEDEKTPKVGVLLGGILDVFCEDVIPGSVPEYFYAAAHMPLALETGKIDAYIDDELSAISHCKEYDAIRIDKVVYADHYGFIFNKENAALCDQMSEYILMLRESGQLDELRKIWIDGGDESRQVVKYDDLTGENGILKIAIAATMPPMIFVKDGEYAGYEVAVLVGFCREYGYGVEFSNLDFSGVMASVTSGVSDIGAASISITDERKESMLFSESHVSANSVSVVRKSDKADGLTPDDFAQSRIGLLDGSIHIATANTFLPDATLHYYSSNVDIANALDQHRIDGYIVDEPMARLMINDHPDQTILTTLEPFSYAFALPKDDPDSEKLQEQLDTFLYKLRESGELREIDDIWFGTDESVRTVDLERLKSNSKMLTFAVFAAGNEPFGYEKDGQYVGYEIDIMARFCAEYGYDLDINEYSFDGLLQALDDGKCDVAAGTIAVTEARQEKYRFSAAHYDGGNVLVVKDYTGEPAEEGFFAGVKDSFYNTFVKESRWKLFVQGILTTVLVAFLSVLVGTTAAFGFHLLYNRGHKRVNRVIIACCQIIEKTPAVVILMILYYIVFGRFDVNAIFVAALGLSMKFCEGVFSLLRIGVGAVSRGQTEAALALSYTPNKAFIRIVFPQAVMHISSGYKAKIVNLIEESSVVGYIAVQDLTKISDIVRARTYEAFFPLIVSAVIYILIALLFIAIVKRIELRIDPKSRKEADILKGIER